MKRLVEFKRSMYIGRFLFVSLLLHAACLTWLDGGAEFYSYSRPVKVYVPAELRWSTPHRLMPNKEGEEVGIGSSPVAAVPPGSEDESHLRLPGQLVATGVICFDISNGQVVSMSFRNGGGEQLSSAVLSYLSGLRFSVVEAEAGVNVGRRCVDVIFRGLGPDDAGSLDIRTPGVFAETRNVVVDKEEIPN